MKLKHTTDCFNNCKARMGHINTPCFDLPFINIEKFHELIDVIKGADRVVNESDYPVGQAIATYENQIKTIVRLAHETIGSTYREVK